MSKWSFHSPTRILFAENGLDSIGSVVSAERAVLITTPGFRQRGVVRRIQESMGGRLSQVLDVVTPNPDIDELDAILHDQRMNESDCIIALGGGSCIDTAKIFSRTIASRSATPLSDHFRQGLALASKATVPVVAIPTTAGPGSEVTPTATIWDRQEKMKYSLSGNDLYPAIAMLDPILTLGLPEKITVSSGLDAVSHAFESIWNRNANPMTLALATESLRSSLNALPRLMTDGGDLSARSNMMTASLMAGLAISQTKTALSHSVSYPLTIEYDVPHGIACSFALPEILEFNSAADDGRLQLLATQLGYETIPRFQAALCGLLETLVLPTNYLERLGSIDNIVGLRERMLAKGRVENNLRFVRLENLNSILETAVERYRVVEER